MDGMFIPVQHLAEVPTNRAAVWDIISTFACSWQRPLAAADGFSEEELVQAEKILGMRLPESLREAYRIFGKRTALTRNQDNLLLPEQLRIDASTVLVFREEHQRCAEWGIALSQIDHPDPPVYWRNLMSGSSSEWTTYHRRVSVDLLENVFNEFMFAPASHVLHTEAQSINLNIVKGECTQLGIPEHVFWAIPDGAPVQWFGTSEVLLRNDADQWVWVTSRSPEGLDCVRQSIPGQWRELSE